METNQNPAAAGAQPPLLGAFVGDIAPADEQNLAAMELFLGRKLDYAVAFLNHNSWGEFDSSVQWELDQWPNHEKLLISVPLTVNGTGLHDVASGAFDQHFVEAAQKIAAYDPNAVIRPGWEMNGDWLPWSAASSPDDYIAAYRHLVDAFRSVSPDFKFDWCVNIGAQAMDPAKAYPGDAYVDTIGMDLNESSDWTGGKTPDQRWDWLLHQPTGLEWHRDFAAAHGKPMSYAEYATNIDDGTFVSHMADWIKQNDVAFHSYWNMDDNIASSFADHPANAAAFKAAWGSGVSPDGAIVLHVSEDAWCGDAQFVVTVDGRQAGGVYTATAAHAAGESQAFTLPVAPAAAAIPGVIAVTFLNDLNTGVPGQDRNLHVDRLDIGGHSYVGHAAQGGQPDPGGVGGGNSTALFGNGTVSFDVQHLTAADYWHPAG